MSVPVKKSPGCPILHGIKCKPTIVYKALCDLTPYDLIFYSSPTSHLASAMLAFFLIFKHANLIPTPPQSLHTTDSCLKICGQALHRDQNLRNSTLQKETCIISEPLWAPSKVCGSQNSNLCLGPRTIFLNMREIKQYHPFAIGAVWDTFGQAQQRQLPSKVCAAFFSPNSGQNK